MSNIGSTALQTKQDTTRTPHVPAPGPREQAFNAGTYGMLDDARSVIENAVGQGMQLNPLIYQMLGLSPQYEDHSADLQSAQGEMDAAQQQYDEAVKQRDSLKALPKGKRSGQQRKQLKALNTQIGQLDKGLADAKNKFDQLQTMPKTITGFSRMDPSQIDKSSPFSSQNPLYQAQATEAQRLNQYLQGGEVDPTLKHQYDAAEQALRAQLSQRYGPDYENSSVGQMALQNFSRQKNEAFATWNQQMVAKYNDLAFQGQQNLQTLLGNQIQLYREPSTNQMAMGTGLSNAATQREHEQEINNQMRLGKAGVSTSISSPAAAAGAAAGGLGQLLKTPYNDQGDTVGGALWNGAKWAGNEIGSGVSSLYDWATGAGTAAAAAPVGDAAAAVL